MDKKSRREFVGGLGAAALVGAALGVEAASAEQPPARRGKKVVPGRPGAPYSRSVGIDRIVFVSGVLGRRPGTRELAAGGFAGQAKAAMEALKAAVEAAGSSMDKVLKCQCFLTEAKDFSTFNEIYIKHFPKDPPARSTVVVKAIVAPGALLEIDCFAYVD